VEKQVYTSPLFDDSKVESIVVFPFQNLSNNALAHQVLKEAFELELRSKTNWEIKDTPRVSLIKLGLDDLSSAFDELPIQRIVNSPNWAGQTQSAIYVCLGKVQEYKYKRGLGEKPTLGVSVSLYKINLEDDIKKLELMKSIRLAIEPSVELWDQGSLSQLAIRASKELVTELIAK
jgi:hypothetical protein